MRNALESWKQDATPKPGGTSEKRPQLNFAVTGETLELIEELKKAFGVDTNTAVLKRALAIARLAAGNQRDDHTITIIGKGEVRRDILLNG
jgi:hypothetical protein